MSFLMQMGLYTLAAQSASPAPIPAPVLAADDDVRALARKILPFPLTGAQKKVLREIAGDLRSGKAMNRLLQGDVGSGKTIVAVLAMLLAWSCGKQSAIMAPTEILAEQHAITMRKLLHGTGIEVGLLTAGLSPGEKRLTKSGLRHGRIAIAVGTHAIFQEDVLFKDLALAVVDEQHRFGVLQRAALRKGVAPICW